MYENATEMGVAVGAVEAQQTYAVSQCSRAEAGEGEKTQTQRINPQLVASIFGLGA